MGIIKVFNSVELDTKINVIEQDGAVYFDLEEVAEALGYKQPKRSIQDFIQQSELLQENGRSSHFFNKIVPESVLCEFLFYSKTEPAKRYRKWVLTEVLPLVHEVGLRAIKKLHVQNLLHQDQSIPRERLIELTKEPEIVDEVINAWQCYRSLGFRPLSDFGVRPAKFYSWACLVGVFDAETGEPCAEYESLMYSCDKYSNSFLVGGVWYAFKEELVDEFLSYKPVEHSVELVLPNDPEVADLFSTPSMELTL